MADSLIIANTIELLMQDNGPPYSTIPGLESTIFALNDQQDTYSRGAPQPTVDILASLITDGERPQGRRASNRTLSIPVAILSDSRESLAQARETLFSLTDREYWTLRYARGDNKPLILDCWRAQPASVTYSELAEQQFSCELTLNFQALPYGRSDTPNTITFASPAEGATPPPDPILLDGFDAIYPGQTAAWELVEASVAGNTSAMCVATSELSQPAYHASFPTPVDLTAGTQDQILNVMRFWAGFASPQFYNNWANHQSEVTFTVTLHDVEGNVIASSVHVTVSHTNDLSKPKWQAISVRMPVSNADFDYTQVKSWNIGIYNFIKNNVAYLKDSTLFLDEFYAASPSTSIASVERGAVYRLNGIEGSVHTPVSFTANQEGSTAPQTVTFTGSGRTSWQCPAGVTSVQATVIGSGGPGSGTGSPAGGGGGGEWAREANIPVTPGRVYPVVAYPAQSPLRAAAQLTADWNSCGRYQSALPTTSVNVNFTANVPVGNALFVQIASSSRPPSVNVTDSAGRTYAWIAYSVARDGMYVGIYASFNIAAATSASQYVTVSFSSPVNDVIIMLGAKQGVLSSMADTNSNGFGQDVFLDSDWWVNNAVTSNLSGWSAGTNTELSMGDIAGQQLMVPYQVNQWQVQNRGVNTINISPSKAGNLIILACGFAGYGVVSAPNTGVSGGGVYTWTRATYRQNNTPGMLVDIWYGIVQETGLQTITVNNPSILGSNGEWNRLHVREFGANADNLTWNRIAASGDHNGPANNSATMTPFPLTGSGLYFSCSLTAQQTVTMPTPPAGYDYQLVDSGQVQMIVTNMNVVNPAPPSAALSQARIWASGAVMFQCYGTSAGSPVGQPYSPVMKVTATATASPRVNSNAIPVIAGDYYFPKMLAYIPTGTSSSMTITAAWTDINGVTISTSTWTMNYPANTWAWNWTVSSGPAVAPSGAATCILSAYAGSSSSSAYFGLAVLGLVRSKGVSGHYLAIVGNSGGVHPVTPAGWTHVDSDINLNSSISCDTYILPAVPAQGAVFGATGAFNFPVNWCVSTIYVWGASWFSRFDGDGVFVQADGGVAGNYLGTGTVSPGGAGSLNAQHSDGGAGALGSGTTGGGGGGSGGSGSGVPQFVDNTDPSFQFALFTSPPQLISSGIPPSRERWMAGNNVFTYGSQITRFGLRANNAGNLLLAVVIPANPNVSPGNIRVVDSRGNNYTYIQRAVLSSGIEALVYYAHKTNQTKQKNIALSVGDNVWVQLQSAPGNYAIFVYAHGGCDAILGAVNGNNGNGTLNGTFSGTSATVNASGWNYSSPGHFVFSISAAPSRNQIRMNGGPTGGETVQNSLTGDAQDFTGMDGRVGGQLTGGSNWPQRNLVFQMNWKGANTSNTSSFIFSRPDAQQTAYVITTFRIRQPYPLPFWSMVSGVAQYRNGTALSTQFANSYTHIAFNGEQAQVIGQTGPTNGQVLVSLNGGPYTIADCYAPASHYQVPVFDTGRLTTGRHTIELITPQWRNASSTGFWVNIDGYQIIPASNSGISAPGQAGAASVPGGGGGGNGGTGGGNGANGGTPGGGGGGPNGLGGPGQVQLTFISAIPPFQTLIMHRPSIDGSKTLLPYIACAKQSVPTSDMVQGLVQGIPPHFNGTYTVFISGAAWASSANSRTVTVTITEYESAPGGVLSGTTSVQTVSRAFIPNIDAPRGMLPIGELTLPNRDIPIDNTQAVYRVQVSSTDSGDEIEDIIFLDTMGQTIIIDSATAYARFFIDEPFPDKDIGYVYGSQFDRDYATSVMDSAFPSGGPLTVEPGDNILFAYSRQGAPALIASYFPRYFIDRTVS